ncbi:MAG TPA: hypothetical protein VGK33_03185 [Chloroflexota bacterium]|jgi:hypothetical protein
MDRRAEALALTTAFLTAIVSVLVFFPAEGRLLVPIHAALDVLFGQMAYVLPLGLAVVSVLTFARRFWPEAPLPRGRLVGVGMLALALAPADSLLGQSSGLVGASLTSLLIGALGGAGATALTLGFVAVGSALALNAKPPQLRPLRLPIAAR